MNAAWLWGLPAEEESAYSEGVSAGWNDGALAEGLNCYRKSEFFNAHEHWEGVWLGLREPEKSFLQALIQTAAAFHHLQSGNPAGTLSLLRRALRRLDACDACFDGVAVEPLRQGIHAWVVWLESGAGSRPERFPPICIVDEAAGKSYSS